LGAKSGSQPLELSPIRGTLPANTRQGWEWIRVPISSLLTAVKKNFQYKPLLQQQAQQNNIYSIDEYDKTSLPLRTQVIVTHLLDFADIKEIRQIKTDKKRVAKNFQPQVNRF